MGEAGHPGPPRILPVSSPHHICNDVARFLGPSSSSRLAGRDDVVSESNRGEGPDVGTGVEQSGGLRLCVHQSLEALLGHSSALWGIQLLDAPVSSGNALAGTDRSRRPKTVADLASVNSDFRTHDKTLDVSHRLLEPGGLLANCVGIDPLVLAPSTLRNCNRRLRLGG